MTTDPTINALFEGTQSVVSGTFFDIEPRNAQQHRFDSNRIKGVQSFLVNTGTNQDRFDCNLKISPTGTAHFTSKTAEQTDQGTKYTTTLHQYDSKTKTTKVVLEDQVTVPRQAGRWHEVDRQLLGNNWKKGRYDMLREFEFVTDTVIVAYNIVFPADFANWFSYSSGGTRNMDPLVPRRGQITFYDLEANSTSPRRIVLDLTTLFYQLAVKCLDEKQPNNLGRMGVFSYSDAESARRILQGKYPTDSLEFRWPDLAMDGSSRMWYDQIARQIIVRHYSRNSHYSCIFHQTITLPQAGHALEDDFEWINDCKKDPYKKRLDQLIQAGQKEYELKVQDALVSIVNSNNQGANPQVIATIDGSDYTGHWQLTPKRPLQGNLQMVPYDLPHSSGVRNGQITVVQASPTQHLFELRGRIYCIENQIEK